MIAMPDFAQGAMENTGCITYRESLLLVDPAASHATRTREHRRRRGPRTRPPMVRQPRDDALVERHLAERGLRHVHGAAHDRRVAPRLGALVLVRAVVQRPPRRSTRYTPPARSSTRSTRPTTPPGMFDVLTYQKGAAILRMLEPLPRPRSVPRRHPPVPAAPRVRQHRDPRPVGCDRGSHRRAGASDHGSVDLAGRVPAAARRTPDADGVRIEQQRFLADGDDDVTTWDVPLRVRTAGAGDERSVLVPAEGRRSPAPADAAVVVNAGASSFVRVRYADDLLERLTARLAELSALERYGLVDDLGPRSPRVPPAPRPSSRFAARFARRGRPRRVAGAAAGARVVRPLRRRRGPRAVPCLRPRSGGARASIAWGGRRGMTTPTSTRALRGALLQGLGVLGADPNAEAAAREFEGEARAGKPTSTPRWPPPRSTSWQSPATPRTTSGSGSGSCTPPRRRSSCATCSRCRCSAIPRCWIARSRACLDGDIRTQNAPFVLAFCRSNRDLGPRAWEFLKEHWDELVEALPVLPDDPHGRRRAVPIASRRGRGFAGVLRDASHPAVDQEPRADARTPAGRSSLAPPGRTRAGRALLRLTGAVAPPYRSGTNDLVRIRRIARTRGSSRAPRRSKVSRFHRALDRRWVDRSGATFTDISPIDERPIAEVARGGADDADAAVVGRPRWLRRVGRDAGPKERAEVLHRDRRRGRGARARNSPRSRPGQRVAPAVDAELRHAAGRAELPVLRRPPAHAGRRCQGPRRVRRARRVGPQRRHGGDHAVERPADARDLARGARRSRPATPSS